MAIKFTCSQCGKTVKAPDAAGGKRGKCPYCGEKMLVPLADSPPVAAPAPPSAAAAPTASPPADLGYGMAPPDEDSDDLKQRLIEQALGMANDLDDDAPPAPAPLPVEPPALPEPVEPAAAAPPEPVEPIAAAAPEKETRLTPEQVAAMSPVDCIANFLTLMSESRLEDASRFVGKMRKAKRQEVQDVLGGLDPASLTSGSLQNVPPPVLKVFLAQMESQLR